MGYGVCYPEAEQQGLAESLESRKGRERSGIRESLETDYILLLESKAEFPSAREDGLVESEAEAVQGNTRV